MVWFTNRIITARNMSWLPVLAWHNIVRQGFNECEWEVEDVMRMRRVCRTARNAVTTLPLEMMDWTVRLSLRVNMQMDRRLRNMRRLYAEQHETPFLRNDWTLDEFNALMATGCEDPKCVVPVTCFPEAVVKTCKRRKGAARCVHDDAWARRAMDIVWDTPDVAGGVAYQIVLEVSRSREQFENLVYTTRY